MRSKIRLPSYLVELLQSINFSATNHERKMKFDELVNRISKFNSINTKYTTFVVPYLLPQRVQLRGELGFHLIRSNELLVAPVPFR